MTLDEFLRLAQIIVTLFATLLSVVLFQKARGLRKLDGFAETQQEFDDKQQQFDKRLAIVETTMRHVPTHNDLLGIRGELNQLNSKLAAVAERSSGTHHMVQTIQEYLMESK